MVILVSAIFVARTTYIKIKVRMWRNTKVDWHQS